MSEEKWEPNYKDTVRIKSGFYRGAQSTIYSKTGDKYLLDRPCIWVNAEEIEKVEPKPSWLGRIFGW